MKTRWYWIALAASLAVVAVCLWLRRADDAKPLAEADDGRAVATILAERSAKQAPRMPNKLARMESPSGAGTNLNLPPPLLTLLATPTPWVPATWPRPCEVPPLDEATQHELIRRFEAPGSLRDKWIVMHILAFGGDAKVVDVLGHALTNTYAGQRLVDNEEGVLIRMVYMMGVTARRHPEVVAFLDQARDPDYWSRVKLWQGRDPARNLQGAAIKAMAWTGLPAAEEMLRAYREDPKPAVKGNVTGAAVSAACILHTVRRYGFDDAWDLLNPPRDESGMGTFSKWVEEVPEAREWMAWSWQADRGAK